MTLERLWLVLAVALPALVCLLVPIPAVDLAYQVRAGEEIRRTGRDSPTVPDAQGAGDKVPATG